MSTITNYRLSIRAEETAAVDLGTKGYPHLLEDSQLFLSGTSAATMADLVWSDEITGTSALNLLSLFTSQLNGAAQSYVDMAGFAIMNMSTTTGYTITVGAGGTPWEDWLGAAGDAVKIPPGGLWLWTAGTVDDAKPGAGASDVLTITCANPAVVYRLVIWGRSA